MSTNHNNFQRPISSSEVAPSEATSLVHRYRPKKFDEVRGQRVPVDYLSGLILRGPVCRNVLLHGSIGSGKTTLARIYAKALNCQMRPPRSASPCLGCASCRAIDAGDATRFAEIDAPRLANLEDLKNELAQLLGLERAPGVRQVIFIDEAHSLSNPRYRGSADFLLKQVEEPPPETSFCFATSAPEDMSDALKSRLVSLRLRPLSVERSIEYLDEIARSESIATEPEAFALIAGFGDGQPRNMLQALDQVSDGGTGGRLKITRERVIDMFGVSRTEQLCQYFHALADGDFARQTSIFFAWNEPIQLKIRLIQSFLLALYYNDLCSLGVTIDPLIASVRPDERAPIMAAFRRRLSSVNLKYFWEDMMAAFPVVTPSISDEALLAYVIAFQRIAGRSDASPRQIVAPERILEGVAGVAQPKRARNVKRAGPFVSIPKLTRDPKYLSMDNVAQLIRAASFVVQEYGIRFNAQISIRHSAFGCKSQDEAAEHFADFSKAIDSRLKAWTGSGHRIGVQEVNEAEGFCGRIVAHLPNDARFVRWSARWDEGARGATSDEDAIRIEFVQPVKKLEGHWRCVRWLCGGLDPRGTNLDQLMIEPECRRIAGDIGTRNRMSISDSLKSAGIRKAAEELGLAALSALDDGVWDRLYDGWELEEHLSRQAHKRLRQAAVEEVQRRYDPVDSPDKQAALDAELAEVRASWPDEYARDRSWQIWKRAE